MANTQKGLGSVELPGMEEIEIDLEKPLRAELHKKFDIVFNRATLEHIFDVQQAFKNLCDLSKDIVILIVPVLQQVHTKKTYGDYWRITTLGIAKMFLRHNFTPIVLRCNDQPFAPVFCFAIATRFPEKYKGTIKPDLDFQMGAALYGSSLRDGYAELLHTQDSQKRFA